MAFWKMLCRLLAVLAAAAFLSCSGDDAPDEAVPNEQTIVMFYPWSGNLTANFRRNVRDMSQWVSAGRLDRERIVVCMATSATQACMYELKNDHGQCVADTLRRYSSTALSTRQGMVAMLADVRQAAPATRYGMIVGGHGLAWVPSQAASLLMRRRAGAAPATRYFGGLTAAWQIDVETFAAALADASLPLEFILFDVCNMSAVEVAYELRHATSYLVACPAEIMAYGFPYAQCGQYLIGQPRYGELIDSFHTFCLNYSAPYATAAVVDCRQMDALADMVRQINASAAALPAPDHSVLQPMDGFTPTLLFDFADYEQRLCSDPSLLSAFQVQMQRTVPYKCHTAFYWSDHDGKALPINHYSGLTTSEPSVSIYAASYRQTSWYRATH